tara:strand:+ start:7444 stop:7851 length:408 start_codon:yes stop_codon:yes gene_type:complete
VAARQGKLAEALSQVRVLQRAEPNNVGHRIREARYQPNDAHVVVWSERLAAANNQPVNDSALRSVLDPVAPDLNAEALDLLHRKGVSSWNRAAREIPSAPSPTLDQPAQQALRRRIETVSPEVFNVHVGYEYSEA